MHLPHSRPSKLRDCGGRSDVHRRRQTRRLRRPQNILRRDVDLERVYIGPRMSTADDLLPEYERQLAILRRSLHEFAQRHPTAAARLSITGEHSEDPHVERLIQSAALQFARAAARIDDKYPE